MNGCWPLSKSYHIRILFVRTLQLQFDVMKIRVASKRLVFPPIIACITLFLWDQVDTWTFVTCWFIDTRSQIDIKVCHFSKTFYAVFSRERRTRRIPNVYNVHAYYDSTATNGHAWSDPQPSQIFVCEESAIIISSSHCIIRQKIVWVFCTDHLRVSKQDQMICGILVLGSLWWASSTTPVHAPPPNWFPPSSLPKSLSWSDRPLGRELGRGVHRTGRGRGRRRGRYFCQAVWWMRSGWFSSVSSVCTRSRKPV